MKLILNPCLPTVQSIASLQGSKLARSVKEQESEEMMEGGIGEKRVSSSAEVSAYVERPVERGRGSKVPMQPRRDL